MKTQDIVYDLETEILKKIAQYLVKGDLEKYSAQWQLEKLKELGGLNSDVKRIIDTYRPKIKKATKQDIEGMSSQIFKDLRAALPSAKKGLIRMTPEMQNQLDTWVRSADNQINISMAKMAEGADQQYVAQLNKASASVVTGQHTLQAAVKMAVTESINAGLPAFVDSASRTWGAEGYTQMVIRTNQRRVATETMLNTGDQLETDLYEISSHLGARPKCALYQGTIVSRYGRTKNYETFLTIGFGDVDGLNGINCGHFFYPFVEGMTQRYHPYPEELNDKAYALSQKQRSYERSIRNAKRSTIVNETSYKESGDQSYKIAAEKSKTRVKKVQATLRDFIKETGRTRRSSREQIY